MICSHKLLKLAIPHRSRRNPISIVSSSDQIKTTTTSSSSHQTKSELHHYPRTCSRKSSSPCLRQTSTPCSSHASSSECPWLKLANLIVVSSIKRHPVLASRTLTTLRASVAQSFTKHLNLAARWCVTSFRPSILSPKPA